MRGVVRLRLDVTDPEQVAAAAATAADTTLLINNAGIATRSNLVTGDLSLIRREMDTHFHGTSAWSGPSRRGSPTTAAGRS
ncbi:hypothetical protein AB0J86_15620 [Micromonospora sp. NPDC049559]|uniref:hypothetical protein n=1 Tax=Micromonospora sp. NPDC049559 TaxID=3155923 RepID=UPI00344A2177